MPVRGCPIVATTNDDETKMYAPGDFTFTAAGGQAVTKQKDGTYMNPKTGHAFATFQDWYRGTTGPYGIACRSAEETGCPHTSIRKAIETAKTRTTMPGRFMFAEEAFAVIREIPELLVLWPTEIKEPVRELAMEFLLYDDIAAHPVWLHCAQEAIRLLQKIDKAIATEGGSSAETR